MPSITTLTNRGQITIPAKLRKQLALRSGKKVLISTFDSTLQIQALDNDSDILKLYGSVDPKNKSTSAEQSLRQAKTIKSQKTAEQDYE